MQAVQQARSTTPLYRSYAFAKGTSIRYSFCPHFSACSCPYNERVCRDERPTDLIFAFEPPAVPSMCIDCTEIPVAVASADCSAKRGRAGSDAVLLMSQSNMSGWDQDYNPTSMAQPTSVSSSGPGQTRSRLPLNTLSTSTTSRFVGMGTSIGRAYAATLPEYRNVLLVPAAQSDSGLARQHPATTFNPSPGIWSLSSALLEDAMTRLGEDLHSGEGQAGNCLAAVLWHQGEADAKLGTTQQEYGLAWNEMIGELRLRLNRAGASVSVILGQFTPAWIEQKEANARPTLNAIKAIAENSEFTTVEPSAGIDGINKGTNDLNGDSHFDSIALRKQGERYFEVLCNALH